MRYFIIISIFVTFCSCQTNKSIVSTPSTPLPCSSYADTETIFYAYAAAKASNVNISKFKAIQEAKAKLANKIAKAKPHINQQNIEKLVEKNSRIVCEKYEEENFRYTTHIGIELEIFKTNN